MRMGIFRIRKAFRGTDVWHGMQNSGDSAEKAADAFKAFIYIPAVSL